MGRYNHSLSLGATIMVEKTAQSLVNTLLSFSLPWQQCDLKTPAALGAYNSETARRIFFIINF